MNLSPMAASYLVSDAEALDTRLPKVAALLAEGRTDWRTVRLIISRTDLINDDNLIAKLDQSLATRLGNWHGWSRQRIINAVDAAVRATDPDAARERRVAAEDERHIGINPLGNGMTEVYGTVAAAAATAFDRRLSQLAKQVCPADPRTLDQRRADALAALTQGRRLACTCGQTDCPSRAQDDGTARDPGGARVVINVVATDQTVHANGDQPGYLEGYRVIDAEQVRRLAEAASVLVANPLTSPVEALRYQPSAALERAVRCRGPHLPLPRMQPPGRCLRSRPHHPVQPSESGGRRTNGAGKPRMSLPSTSSTQDIRRVAGYPTGRRSRHLDLAHRTDLSDLTGRGRPLPTTACAGMRVAGRQQTKQIETTKCSNCSGAQAQPRATTCQLSPPPVGASTEEGNRWAQIPKP
jgi:hypothetical protein